MSCVANGNKFAIEKAMSELRDVKVGIPKNEMHRLKVLWQCNLLDSNPNESSFDRLIALAARILNVECCSLSVVGTNRVWFKSKVGFGAEEVHRNISFASEVTSICGDNELLVILDTKAIDQYRDAELVNSPPFIRFYAGVPIFVDNVIVASICLFDPKPRTELSMKDRMSLLDIGRAMTELIMERRNRSLNRAINQKVMTHCLANLTIPPATAAREVVKQMQTAQPSAPFGELSKALNKISLISSYLFWNTADYNSSDNVFFDHEVKLIIPTILQESRVKWNVSPQVKHQRLNQPEIFSTLLLCIMENILFQATDIEVNVTVRENSILKPINETQASGNIEFTGNLPGFLVVSVHAKDFSGTFIQDTKVSDTDIIAQLLHMSGGGYTLDMRDGELQYSFWMGCAGEFSGTPPCHSEVMPSAAQEEPKEVTPVEVIANDGSPAPPITEKTIQLKVLIVDDSIAVQRIFSKWLENHGCMVRIAENGLLGLTMMKARVYDIVFMDFLMPVMDGIECVRRFTTWLDRNPERAPNYSNTLIVGLSAMLDKKVHKQGFRVGMHLFIDKPPNAKTLEMLFEAKRKGSNPKEIIGMLRAYAAESQQKSVADEPEPQESVNI